MSNFWKILWIFTLLIMALQMFIYYPALPQKMAVHFDFYGKPNGWSSKGDFLAIWILIIALVNMGLPLVRILMRKFPRHLINIPNKEYWLSDEKRKMQMIGVVENMMAMMFAMVNLIFIYALKYTYDMNLKGNSSFKIWLIFIPTIFIIVGPLIYLYKKLRIPQDHSGNLQT